MKKILLSACILLMVSACKKNEGPPVRTVSEMLAGGAWKLSHLYINNIEDTTSCIKDDKLEFLSNGVYRDSPGAHLCFSAEAVGEGNWHLELNDAILVIEAPAYTYRYKINFITTSRIDMEGMVNNKLHLLYLNRY